MRVIWGILRHLLPSSSSFDAFLLREQIFVMRTNLQSEADSLVVFWCRNISPSMDFIFRLKYGANSAPARRYVALFVHLSTQARHLAVVSWE